MGAFLLHWLHLLAAILWIGGMLFTAIVLTPLTRRMMAAPVRLPFLKALGERFKYVEWGCLAVLLVTGVEKVRESWGWVAVWETSLGTVLALKLALVAGMIGLSVGHSFVWGPRVVALGRQGQTESPAYQAALRTLVWGARLNVVLGLGVVGCGAWLRIGPW